MSRPKELLHICFSYTIVAPKLKTLLKGGGKIVYNFLPNLLQNGRVSEGPFNYNVWTKGWVGLSENGKFSLTFFTENVLTYTHCKPIPCNDYRDFPVY